MHLLNTPPLAPDLPDIAVFPCELMALSDQWQAEGLGYVAAIRAHQLAIDAAETVNTDSADAAAENEDGEEESEEEKEDNE